MRDARAQQACRYFIPGLMAMAHNKTLPVSTPGHWHCALYCSMLSLQCHTVGLGCESEKLGSRTKSVKRVVELLE